MGAIKIEEGDGPGAKRRYPDNAHEYMQGYFLAQEKRYLLTPSEYTNQISAPVRDSFSEGWHDGIAGKAARHER